MRQFAIYLLPKVEILTVMAVNGLFTTEQWQFDTPFSYYGTIIYNNQTAVCSSGGSTIEIPGAFMVSSLLQLRFVCARTITVARGDIQLRSRYGIVRVL